MSAPRQMRMLGIARSGLRPGEIAVDLFAGGGGWSEGFQWATGVPPAVAVNHDAHAISMHQRNHPEAAHHHEDVFEVDPVHATHGRPVGWLHLSPDCTHFSRAKGGKPRSNSIRGLAWVAIRWAKEVRPRILSLENVAEFQTWGPLDSDGNPDKARAGETFNAFVEQLRSLGYQVQWRALRACDFGAPTTRNRLFLVARCDGAPIAWPAPTHGPKAAKPWRTAAECIDWSIPCPSIFTRKKPLAEATQRRIAEGIRRFVLEAKNPFVVNLTHGARVEPLDEPMRTVTGANRGEKALAVPFVASIDHRGAGDAPVWPLGQPLTTVTRENRHALVCAFLAKWYGEGGQWQSCDDPLHTVPTKDRFGLVTVRLDGVPHVIVDIGLRMLTPRELARAQGFPETYVLTGTKSQQVERIGNSVCPHVAAALVRANIEEV